MDDVYAQIAIRRARRHVGRDLRQGVRRADDLSSMTSGPRRPHGRGAQLPARRGAHRHHQAVRPDRRVRSGQPHAAPRADPRHPRRERCRQVDADEGAHRPRPARCRADPSARSAGADRRPHRCRRARHRHGAPALQPRRGAHRVGERRAGRRRSPRPARTCASGSAQISEQYGLDIDPDDRIADLPAGMRQRVEIIKCLRRDPEVLVFDEPTSVLSPSESEFLFDALRRVVQDEGKAVALVSHKLPEILSVTDEVTIMRDGRVVQAGPTAGADASTLARAMVGRDVVLRSEHAAFGVVDVDAAHAAATSGSASPTAIPAADSDRARAGAATRRRHAPRAATVGCCSTDSTSRSTPARSSASPASRTTASAPSATCSRACRTSTAGRVEVERRRGGHGHAPVRWRVPASR